MRRRLVSDVQRCTLNRPTRLKWMPLWTYKVSLRLVIGSDSVKTNEVLPVRSMTNYHHCALGVLI